MANGQSQIQGVPPGVTLEPIPQTGAQPSGADTSNIQGVPPGVTLEPVAPPTVSKAPAAAADANAISNMDMIEFTQKLRQDPNFRQQVSSVRERLPQGMQDTLAQEESVTKPGGESGIAGIMTGA